MRNQAEQIKDYLLVNISNHPVDIVAVTAKHFSVTRTTVHRHLNALLKNGQILKSGTTRSIRYYTLSSQQLEFSYRISKSLSEYDVFLQDFRGFFKRFHHNIYDICLSGFTEIFNNAIDHSYGTTLTIKVFVKNDIIHLTIQDNGIGVFNSIYEYLRLKDIRESVLELSKGKMTTDPANHTGEGIFFTSKVFDRFEIEANQLYYICDNKEEDWSVETLKTKTIGSKISLKINIYSKANLTAIFKKFQNQKTLAFDKTEIIVELSKIGDEVLMSRSQAKRIIFGLEKFRRVILNFHNVRLVGQGFVDEIFRIFRNAHPKIKIEHINANNDVLFMIKRSIA